MAGARAYYAQGPGTAVPIASLESPLDEVDNTPQECTMYRHGTVTARNSCCYPPDPEQGVIYSAPAGVADLSKLTPPCHVEAP